MSSQFVIISETFIVFPERGMSQRPDERVPDARGAGEVVIEPAGFKRLFTDAEPDKVVIPDDQSVCGSALIQLSPT